MAELLTRVGSLEATLAKTKADAADTLAVRHRHRAATYSTRNPRQASPLTLCMCVRVLVRSDAVHGPCGCHVTAVVGNDSDRLGTAGNRRRSVVPARGTAT